MSKRFTGEVLLEKDPEKYWLVVESLKVGTGIQAIADNLAVSPGTVRAIRRAHASSLPGWRDIAARNLADFIQDGTERLAEHGDELSLGQLPVSLAISIDKLAALQGTASVIVEHRVTGKAQHGQIIDIVSALPGEDEPGQDSHLLEGPTPTQTSK